MVARRLVVVTALVMALAPAVRLAPSRAADSTGPWVSAPARAVAPEAAREGRLLQRQPAGAFGAGVYLVAWCDGSRRVDRPTADIYGARIEARTGRVLDPRGIPIATAEDLQEWPAVAFDGSKFLVVWQDFRSGRRHDIYAARVRPPGEVLDPGGIPVAAGPSNQARPSVAFAAGRYLVAWMDARAYPVYGIYGARVAPSGDVLDPEGLPLDVEDPARIAAARPPAERWLGDRDVWWRDLASRVLPVAASGGGRVLVAYVREYPRAQNPRPAPTAVIVDPGTGRTVAGPAAFRAGVYATIAACATSDGWALVLSDWSHGWTPRTRLAVLRLDADLETRDAFAKPFAKEPDRLPVEVLDGSSMPEGAQGLNPGKGAVAFWRAAAAWNGRHVVAATDFGWRDRRRPDDLRYVIAACRAPLRGSAFLDPSATLLASSRGPDRAVANPALVEGPDGEVLLLYEEDGGPGRHRIVARLLCERRGPGDARAGDRSADGRSLRVEFQ